MKRALLLLLLLLAFAGCRSTEHAGHDHEGPAAEHGDHGHGPTATGITRWTEKLELYAEHPPAIAGQELPFLAHLTILDGFRPLEDATVTLVLDGPAHAEAKAERMARPGIFKPTLTAPPAGTYRARLEVSGPAVQDTLGDLEVVVFPDAAAAAAAAEHEETPGRISFLKEQQWQIPFATAFAARGAVVPTLEVSGEVTTPPGGQAEVGAVSAGRVVAPASGLPRPGRAVRRGELLALIAPAPASPEDGARADLLVVEAEARAQAARAALDRAERLVSDRALSTREVEDARRELLVAEEAVRAARRARDVFSGAAAGGGGAPRVTAPIDGVVVQVEATAGKSVQAGELLFRVVNLRELWIRARVPEQDAALVRGDRDAPLQVPGVAAWLPLHVGGDDAYFVDVGRTVDPRSRTVDVIYGLRRPDERLRVGGLVRVAVPAGDPWEGVVVPASAVLEDDGRSVLYVQAEGESFEERAVRVGPRSGALAAVVAGLREGERIVTSGATVIRLASRAATAPAHGHVH